MCLGFGAHNDCERAGTIYLAGGDFATPGRRLMGAVKNEAHMDGRVHCVARAE